MSETVFFQVFFENEILYLAQSDKALGNAAAPPSARTLPGGGLAERAVKPSEPPAGPELKTRTVIVVKGGSAGLREEERLLLANILKAVGLGPAQTDVLELEKLAARDLSGSVSREMVDHVVLFGLLPAEVQLEISPSPYLPCQSGNVWYLQCDDLTKIGSDNLLKKQLWVALQQVFLKK